MSEHEAQAGPVVKVAQHLTAIVEMCALLPEQAISSANDHDIPGGEALVALAPVADPDDYRENVEAAEWHHEANPLRWGTNTLDMAHEDDDLAPILQTLWFWSDEWRTIHSQELGDRKATIASEANFIRWALDWAWDNEPHWDDFAEDIRKCRRHLENTVRGGQRPVRVRVVCPDCDANRQLICQFGATPDDDRWKCPTCKHKFDADAVARAWAKQMRSQGAERWVPIADVISVMRSEGWRADTVRSWFERLLIEAYCEVGTRQTAAWWPDVWHTHLTMRHARQVAAKRAADLKARKAICIEGHGEECWIKGRGCEKALAEAS